MAATSTQLAKRMQTFELIDETSNLNGAPVFIYSGMRDESVVPAYSLAQQIYYNNFGANVEYVSQDTGHEIPAIFSPNEGMNKSGLKYDLAGNLLKHLTTNLATGAIPVDQWAEGNPNWREMGVLRQFYQDEFLDTSIFQVNGLAKYGYIYYPNNCIGGNCRVHMHLHGCGLTAGSYFYGGFEKITQGGWMEYAAANDIIVVMPQAEWNMFSNPIECFDYTNYVNPWDETAYITQQSSQLNAFKNMLARISMPQDS